MGLGSWLQDWCPVPPAVSLGDPDPSLRARCRVLSWWWTEGEAHTAPPARRPGPQGQREETQIELQEWSERTYLKTKAAVLPCPGENWARCLLVKRPGRERPKRPGRRWRGAPSRPVLHPAVLAQQSPGTPRAVWPRRLVPSRTEDRDPLCSLCGCPASAVLCRPRSRGSWSPPGPPSRLRRRRRLLCGWSLGSRPSAQPPRAGRRWVTYFSGVGGPDSWAHSSLRFAALSGCETHGGAWAAREGDPGRTAVPVCVAGSCPRLPSPRLRERRVSGFHHFAKALPKPGVCLVT